MKIRKQFDRAFIALDAYIKGHRKSRAKEKPADKTILIIFQQIYGDAVVIQNSLQEYMRIFPKTDGYMVKFLVRPSVAAFMKETMGIPHDMEIVPVDFKKFLEDFNYYREVTKEYRGKAETLIVPGTSLSAEIFAVANDARRKIGLVRSVAVKRPIAMAVFAKLAYTERVKPEQGEMILQQHRRLINYLSGEDYEAKLPTLLPKERMVEEAHYAVLGPAASKMEKCWPIERFSEIADYIIENYDINVHLCGGNEELELERRMLLQTKHSSRVISHIGRTSFSEWSAIVQHADLVVGNDSATIHLAAASRRKAICIVGAYDKGQFFPYKPDFLEEGDILPVALMKDMPCACCRMVGYYAGYKNLECKARIKKNQCAICIDAISVNDVKREVKRLLGKGNE